jgi:hypothetical protein
MAPLSSLAALSALAASGCSKKRGGCFSRYFQGILSTLRGSSMKQRPRRTETPVTTHVAVLQGLRLGRSSATDLIGAIELVARRLVRRLVRPTGAAHYELTALGRRQAKSDAAAIARLFETLSTR